MRKSVLAALIIVQTLLGATANAAYNPTKPVVTQCTASTTSISEAGGQLQITLRIVDPTPVNYVVVNVMNSSGNSIAFGSLSLQSGTATDGDWSKTFTVKPDLKPDLYSVVAQNVMDTSNNDLLFYTCPNLKINYGNVAIQIAPPAQNVTPRPTPTPRPTALAKPTQGSDTVGEVLNLKSQVALLQSQLRTIEAKMRKVCSAKPKPKGC